MKKNFLTRIYIIIFFAAVSLIGCQKKSAQLFELLSPEQTGITFNNVVEANDTFNILTHEYIYNGGGVGIADFNNDGLQDLFFCGNLVPNKLYLNEGEMRFRDVTEEADINEQGRWNSGVAIADINQDGWMDIYVCATMRPDSLDRRNMLFVNNGLNEDGIPTFTNRAHDYNVEHDGFSVTAAFFDYDKDDDLDLYLLINQRMDNIPTNYRPRIVDGSAPNNDRLFRNDGNGSFTDVTMEAGILHEGFGLGLAIADLNVDGWPDIYVSNDYLSNDILYINNKNGKFENRIAEFIGHQSQFSMGNDAADFNNDRLPDIITTDMLPETNDRKKTTIGNKSYLTYINNEKYHYEHQYVRNMLHLNNGLSQGIKFSEIGQLAGIHQTEWSWSPLFADFDNDGFKDLIITNGFPKDVTDKDFANYRSTVGNIASMALLEDSIPVVEIPNYAFRNKGDLTFEDVTREWGFGQPSFSNGAAFGDLDNDGDLDYVINNINSPASVYRNTLYDAPTERADINNFLRIKLVDSSLKKSSVGAKVTIFANGLLQYYENNVYRGFLSSVENVVHFGLGRVSSVDSVVVEWSDGNVQTLTDPPINRVLTIEYRPTIAKVLTSAENRSKATLLSRQRARGLAFKHEEDDKIDFNVQRTLPHKFTQSGPGIAVGDVNLDGSEDVVVGGSTGYTFSVFIQQKDGSFSPRQRQMRNENKSEEDTGVLLFDADNDKDLDLYVVSGSMEHFQSKEPYQDRLYLNDGNGNFQHAVSALPDTRSSGSCVRAADIDGDADLDLFVGGRMVPGQYPATPESYLLLNDNGLFKDVTTQFCAELKDAGMITDAIWTDFNGDLKPDLIAVGEFTSIMFFVNDGKSLKRIATDVDDQTGWWNSIAGADFDLDGDIDYVVGNLGLNNAYHASDDYPLTIVAKDFDDNESMDAILGCYMRVSMNSDEKRLFPIHFWDELNTQSPKFRNQFSRYRQYGKATMDDLLTAQDREGAIILQANRMASVYVENLGNNNFKISDLPALAQIAPVNGLLVADVNADGFPDVVMTGNDYGNEVFTGRYDAFNGLVLVGDGQGTFSSINTTESGFLVPGDAKALVTLPVKGADLFIASQNRDSIVVFEREHLMGATRFTPEALDVKAELLYADGRRQIVEFYYGSGYLSQSTRTMTVPKGVVEMIVFNSRGASRKVAVTKM